MTRREVKELVAEAVSLACRVTMGQEWIGQDEYDRRLTALENALDEWIDRGDNYAK